MHHTIIKYLKFGTFITFCVFVSCNKGGKKPIESVKPNIILIYADDLGIGLLEHEGQEIINTPHIDQLAQDGIRFKRAYSNMLCAPARASLITGLHDSHKDGFEITAGNAYRNVTKINGTFTIVENKLNKSLSPIPDDQVFLGEVAKSMGYKTAQFGKLEWGFSATDKQMKRHGWDTYFGYLDHVRAHGFYPPFLIENGEIIEIAGNTRIDCGKTIEPEGEKSFKDRWDMEGKKVYSQTLFMNKTLNFIEANKDNPFFLYFPTQLPHGPVSIPKVHPDFENDARLSQIEKEYASMVKLLDDNVGQILKKLNELNIEENTMVIFMADNGHEIYYNEKGGRLWKPYKNAKTGLVFDNYKNKFYSDLAGDVFNGNGSRAGLKRSNLEGGINVPLIVKWPRKIKNGRISNRLVASYDVLPTIAELTGFSKPIKTDGISFYKELLGETNIEHEYVVYSSFIGPTLITNDGWKIRTFLKDNAFELYYLPNDFKEEHDLAENHPEKLELLKTQLLKACDGDFNNGFWKNSDLIKITN